MCGFAGILRFDNEMQDVLFDGILHNMIREIAYRGPDDEQILRDGPFGVAFRRLSIIDIAGGRQPLWNEDHSIAVVANGEIYNYQELAHKIRSKHAFKTASDCEIILHLYEDYGQAFVEQLVGMYAFALWDRPRKKLLLGRDRFGIKPLFYTINHERIVFASEIKALFRYPDCPKEFNWEIALTDPSINGSALANTTTPESYFSGIVHLPASSLLEVDFSSRQAHTKTYWNLPLLNQSVQPPDELDSSHIIEQYMDLLEKSVENCLTSEAEIGSFLSGGIDSAIVTALAARQKALHTFTVLSQSTFANHDAQYAHQLAHWCHIPNHQVLFRWQEGHWGPEEWKNLLWLSETPLCGPEQMYKHELYRYAKTVRPQLKVMLTGQGSDEFNGGYSSLFVFDEHKTDPWQSFISALELIQHEATLRTVPPTLSLWEEHFHRSPLSRDYLHSISKQPLSTDVWSAYVTSKFRDLQMYNCWHEDRIAMGNGVENRVPFLDHRIVELVLGISRSLRASLLWDKNVLRKAAVHYLPQDLCDRPKVPFFYGQDARYTHRMMLQLLMSNNCALLEEAFSGGRASEIVDRDAVQDIVHTIDQDPELMNFEFLLRLVNMGLLEQMAYNHSSSLNSFDKLSIRPTISIENWNASEETIALKLAIHNKQLDQDCVLSFAPNVVFVRRQECRHNQEWYLLVDEKLTYVLTEDEVGPWLRILQEIDGVRTLGELLHTANVHEADIRKFLEEAVNFGVIVAHSS